MSGTYNAGGEGAPIESKAQLIGHIAAGEKPSDQWRIGTEHEKFGFALKDHAPLPYEGDGPSVRKLLFDNAVPGAPGNHHGVMRCAKILKVKFPRSERVILAHQAHVALYKQSLLVKTCPKLWDQANRQVNLSLLHLVF